MPSHKAYIGDESDNIMESVQRLRLTLLGLLGVIKKRSKWLVNNGNDCLRLVEWSLSLLGSDQRKRKYKKNTKDTGKWRP